MKSKGRLVLFLARLIGLGGLGIVGITSCQPIMENLTLNAPPPQYNRYPVLFVHGSGHSAKSWAAMMRGFRQLGYPADYLSAVDMEPRNGSNIRAANQFVAPAVESLLQRATAAAKQSGYAGQLPTKVNIVAHSMGVLSSRWYISQLHPDRVKVWVGLAGANHGTNTLCSSAGEGDREMCPPFAQSRQESALQVTLNGTASAPLDETPYGIGRDRAGVQRIQPDAQKQILYWTLRIEPDAWIKPEKSAIIDGAGGMSVASIAQEAVTETSPGNFLLNLTVEHDPLIDHPDVIRIVDKLLTVSPSYPHLE
jgi:pimeloyl-ACP methyl ester carboxylesterase